MRNSDALGSLKHLFVQTLQWTAAAGGSAHGVGGASDALTRHNERSHHVDLPHRGMTEVLPLAQPANHRKLATVSTGVTSVQLGGCTYSGYSASATVGGGAKVSGMHLLVDTASVDAVLASTACTNCDVSPVYNATLGRAEDVTLHGTFRNVAWTGLQSIDQIDLGPGAFASTSLAALTSQSSIFDDAGCVSGSVPNTRQGILGMGPIALSASGLNTGFFWSVSQAKAILSLALCEQGGYLFLGSAPTTNTGSGAFQTPLLQSDYYAVEVSGMSVGTRALAVSADTLGPAILASGSYGLVVPQAAYSALVQAITAGQTHLTSAFFTNEDCIAQPAGLDLTTLPKLTLAFASGADGSGTASMGYPATNSYITFLKSASGGNPLICPGLFNSGTGGETLLGSSLMRNTMTTVNWFTKMVTLGPSVGVCS